MAPKKNLLNICVFHNKQYLDLLNLLLQTLYFNGQLDERTNILIMTAPDYLTDIQELVALYKFRCGRVSYMIRPYTTLLESAAARLHIFEWAEIDAYDKILYIDTDVLINNDLNVLFWLHIDDGKLYALTEGHLGLDFYGGGRLFGPDVSGTTAFTTGVLLYKNSPQMRQLFTDILDHMARDAAANAAPYECLEQPYVVYNAYMRGAYNNTLLEAFVENNPTAVSADKYIYHFPGGPGHYLSKIDKMMYFTKKLLARAAAAAQLPTETNDLAGSTYAVYKRNAYGSQKEEYVLLLHFCGSGNTVRTSFKYMNGTYMKAASGAYIIKLIKHINIVIFDDAHERNHGIFLNTPDNDIYFIRKMPAAAAAEAAAHLF